MSTKKFMGQVVRGGLDVLSDILEAHGGKKGELGAAAITAMTAIVDSLRGGMDREITPDQAIEQIEESQRALAAGLAANDKHAKDLLDKKFGPKPTE